MQTSPISTALRYWREPAVFFLFAIMLTGCGGPIAFSGKSALTVVGEPPAPPPPPPRKEEPTPRVELRDNKIEIHEKIQFDFDKATIKEVSFSLLNEVASVIKKNPHIKKIAIEGHASAEGIAGYNLQLSDQRAKAVMKYLVEHGIPKEALTAQGYGVTRPVADNDTDAGREKNRRVEFNITEQDITKKKVEIDPTTGKERVLEVLK
jgi:outer membrane protein OmpA-like peptidoglycan-associated protein